MVDAHDSLPYQFVHRAGVLQSCWWALNAMSIRPDSSSYDEVLQSCAAQGQWATALDLLKASRAVELGRLHATSHIGKSPNAYACDCHLNRGLENVASTATPTKEGCVPSSTKQKQTEKFSWGVQVCMNLPNRSQQKIPSAPRNYWTEKLFSGIR